MESKIIKLIKGYWECFSEISEEEYLQGAKDSGSKLEFKKNYTYCVDADNNIIRFYKRKNL
jgi:hypothetical protein